MKPVREVVSREVIDDLWGAGYTILPRNRHPDPFFVPPEMVPQGRSYQWWHLVHDKFHFDREGSSSGWAPVPANRHDGYFMPAGFVGDIEVNGLGLFEKSKFEVDQDKAAQVAAAHKQVDDWKAKWGGAFSGEVSVGGNRTEIGATKTIESTTAIPRDMVPYIAQIFEERDRLAQGHIEALKSKTGTLYCQEFADWMEDHPNDPQWPVLHAMLLPKAIENIRQRITEEANNAQAS